MDEFSQKVREKLRAYVYFLRDPRNSEIFYIGKGRGNRVFQHVSCAIKRPKISDKLDRIREIGPDKVEHYILRHGMTNDEAFEVEASLIDFIESGHGLIKASLTNEQSGHDSEERGVMFVEDVEAQYAAKKLKPQHPMILININRRYLEAKSGLQIDADKLYEVTSAGWRIGRRREEAQFALAAYKGLVREVYRLDGWGPVGNNHWRFTGQVATPEIRELYYMTSYEHLIKNGATNPIRYLGMQ